MSMINDALRRANSAAQGSGSTPPPLPGMPTTPTPRMMPDQSTPALSAAAMPEPERKTALPLLLVGLLIICVAGAAVIYLWEKSRRSTIGQSTTRRAPHVVQTPSPSAGAPEKQSTLEQPQAATSTRRTEGQAMVSPNAAANPASAEPQPASEAQSVPANVRFPSLRLQSIFYKPSNPSVMINGQTLFLNEEIQGVTVAAIDPASVTLVLSGRTNILTLR